MTKKDYIVIAAQIKAQDAAFKAENGGGSIVLYDLAGRLCDAFERDNSRFDRRRFFDACFGK